jgi:hypothetical protein
MANANTNILIKRSTVTSSPVSLQSGELAYSYLSNTAFIGTNDGTGVIKIGGQYYTSQIDAASSANGSGTLVKRDATGNVAFNYVSATNITGALAGNANTATYLQNPQNFSISGGDISATAISFGGNNSVTLNASLNSITGLTAGSYGSSSAIPVISVAANGRVTSISTSAISSSFTVSGNTGSGTQNNGGTLSFQGGSSGITTTVSGTGGNETVTINTDNTILRSNTSSVGPQSINTDLNISGNLVVSGSQTFVNTNTVQAFDSLIQLAANNSTGDVLDIGFYGEYNNGSAVKATGLVRDAGNKNYYLFKEIDLTQISSANTIANTNFTTSNTATLYTQLVVPGTASFNTTANVTNDLAVGGNIYNTGKIASTEYDFNSGTAKLTTDGTNLILNPGTGALAGIQVSGNGYVLGPRGSRNMALDYNGNAGLAGIYQASIYSGVAATSTTTGALVVSGGVGISGSTYIGGNLSLSGTVTSGTWNGSTIGIAYGGTGSTSFTSGQRVVYNGTSLVSQANVGSPTVTGTLGAGSTITSFSTNTYGEVTSYTASSIAIDASQVTTGTLGVTRGGTGSTTFNVNGIVYGAGTSGMVATAAAGVSDVSGSKQLLTVNASGVPVWTTSLDGGSF